MAKVTRTILINTTPDRVFSVLDDPKNLPLLYYCVFNVHEPEQSTARIGDKFTGMFSMLGIQFHVSFTITEYVLKSRLTASFEGGVKGKMSYTLEPEHDSTRVTIEVEYEISNHLLPRIANRSLFEQMETKNAERILENLSMIVEATIPPVQA